MSLAGTRVLVIEDEAIIAMTAEDMLEELGCTLAGTAATLADALAAADTHGFDVALLDINLNGAESLPVAEKLRARGVPFIFTTGYGAAGHCDAYPEAELVTKPYRMEDLEGAIQRALGS